MVAFGSSCDVELRFTVCFNLTPSTRQVTHPASPLIRHDASRSAPVAAEARPKLLPREDALRVDLSELMRPLVRRALWAEPLLHMCSATFVKITNIEINGD